jgi:hypothetical protein
MIGPLVKQGLPAFANKNRLLVSPTDPSIVDPVAHFQSEFDRSHMRSIQVFGFWLYVCIHLRYKASIPSFFSTSQLIFLRKLVVIILIYFQLFSIAAVLKV